MAISGEKLVKMSREEIENLHKNFGTKCAGSCGRKLSHNKTGIHTVRNGFMCDDCYYEGLGKIIEGD